LDIKKALPDIEEALFLLANFEFCQKRAKKSPS
jgi:hypothetical protein